MSRDTTINQFVDKNLESKIVTNDLLGISVSSLNKMEDEFYNISSLSSTSENGTSSSVSSGSITHGNGYTVDIDGNIEIHNLGKMHAEGMTRKQLKDSLENKLLPFLKDPIVTVSFLNRRITVLGEVVKPQVLDLQEEQMPLLDALAMTGDVTPNALKKNILVIRQTPTGKTFKHINLEDQSLFADSSHWYYLQSGDVVYVEPNLRKMIREQQALKNQQTFTIGIAIISLLLLTYEITR
ncbi:MAG TPA: polysaccharide biosynthesis/export family protein [Bacteroidia bacterium]|nr:polysaccharide biosynthesis/export family protein [Bacteroidia bacterium]